MAVTGTMIKRAFMDTPDGQIHYVAAGAGEPILLLHQTPTSSDEYADVIPILARTNLVVAMDTMGYGDSDTPTRQYFIEDYARTVPLLLDQLGIQRVTLVGHHTGSFIAAEVAASYPERIDRLVLSGFFNMDAAERERSMQPGAWVQWYPEADGSHLAKIWGSAMKRSKDDLDRAHRNLMNVLRAGTASEYGHWAVGSWHQEERIPLIQAPTFLIWGIKDLEASDRRGRHATRDKHKVGEAIPGCREVDVPEGTSAFPEEMPEVFSELILGFVKEPGV